MSRIYTKKGDKWNIYSTICDDLLFDYWLDFEELKNWIIGEMVNDTIKKLETLLTDKPAFNYMPYEELIEEFIPRGEEDEDN